MSSLTTALTWENVHYASCQCEKVLVPVLEVSAVTAVASLIFSCNGFAASIKNVASLGKSITPLALNEALPKSLERLHNSMLAAGLEAPILGSVYAPFPLSLLLNQDHLSLNQLASCVSLITSIVSTGNAIFVLSFKIACIAGVLLGLATVLQRISAQQTKNKASWNHWKPWVTQRLPIEIASLMAYGFLSVWRNGT